ncbi:MAG: IS1 family transposase [Pleurocapsa sp.]
MSISCASCESKQIVKNGKIHNGKQNYRGRDCGRQLVENRQQKIIG